MVRPAHTGRSRGCAPCRRKRIKCDLGEPECQRCLAAGTSCPGPLHGPFILMSEKGQLPRKSTHPGATPRPQPTHLSAAASTLQKKAVKSILLSTFVQYLAHSARRSSWTLSLPILAGDGNASTAPFRSALNAVSLVYFAHTTSDAVFSNHASREYGRALSLQRQALYKLPSATRLPSESRSDVLAVLKHALLASTILSYYELIAAVNSIAWTSHTEACERLLCLMGTDAITEDVLVRQLAVSVRSHAILRAAVYAQRTVFAYEPWISAAQQWTKLQRQTISRDAYDWVVEFVLRLSTHVRAKLTTDSGVDKSDDSAEGRISYLAELEANYADFLLSLQPPIFVSTLPLFHTPASPLSPATSSPTLPGALRKQFPSMALAYFHAAALLLRHHFPQPTSRSAYNVQWITSVGKQLEQDSRTNATAVMRMGFPFAMIWRCAGDCDTERRNHAREIFDRWCRKEGMTGLCVIAFNSMI